MLCSLPIFRIAGIAMAFLSHSTFVNWETPGFGQGFGLLALAVLSPFILTWIVTVWKSWSLVWASKRAAPGEKRPPTLPTAIPFLGHVFQFMQDGHAFLYNAVQVLPFHASIATSVAETLHGLC